MIKSSPSIWHLLSKRQIGSEDFIIFCGLLGKHELYKICSPMSVRENTILKSINIYKRYIFPNLSSNPRVEAWRIKRYILFRKCIYFWCAFLSPVVTNPECLV